MKKSMFILACAAATCGFAALPNLIGFEDYTEVPFSGLGGKQDNGDPGVAFWYYDGSGDASTVKAYETAPATGNNKYLELSTEGGTLWRNINNMAAVQGGSSTFADPQPVGANGIYVDTMVQFTPTEDGGTPDIGDGKLAIWLNVDSNGVKNLCVLGRKVFDDGSVTTFSDKPVVFNFTNVVVEPGTWYRLTVKAIANCNGVPADVETEAPYLGFEVQLDGQLLATDESSFTPGYMNLVKDANYGWLNPNVPAQKALIDKMEAGQIVLAVNPQTAAELTAVGFKGSGAIDSLGITDIDPIPGEADVDWEHPKQQSGTAAEMFGLTGDLAALNGVKLAAWATAKSVAFKDASTIILDAYLLNCANTTDAVDVAKEEFKITSITIGADGTVTVTTPADKGYNGTVTVKGCATVNGTYDLDIDNPNARFFKAFLQ